MTLVRFNYPSAQGWAARSRAGRSSKLFRDSKFGGELGSRAAAQAFADDFNRDHPEEFAPKDLDRKPRSNNRSGIPGVSLVSCSPRSDGGHAWTFWQALCPGGPDGRRPSWYKKFTCSVHGFDRARELAIEFRGRYVAARDAGTLAEFWRKGAAG